ncbi:MAG: hypothetical protein NZM29_04890 [Nitrospira sp.]|nr:hypothetical protein [Nitrospira sp.]
MKDKTSSVAAGLAGLLFMSGCVYQPLVPQGGHAESATHTTSVLAGEWEYEDGAVVMLRLDERGNGTYPYQDGRFETLRLDGHVWIGKWYQKENDREGGFKVVLSDDYTEGDGTWWYNRIEKDFAPKQKGGTFHLSKRTSFTQLGATPPAP